MINQYKVRYNKYIGTNVQLIINTNKPKTRVTSSPRQKQIKSI